MSSCPTQPKSVRDLAAARTAMRLSPWLRLFRFRFYPLSVVTLATGSLAGATAQGVDWAVLAWGAAAVVLLQMITVVANEVFDLEADRRNQRFGAFGGGSRVLVDGDVSLGSARRVLVALAVVLCAVTAYGALRLTSAPTVLAASVALGATLGLGYSVPPLRLCYRGWGEVTVAFTYSFYLFAFGYFLQAGSPPEAALLVPICLPLFLAILPAIVLANVADAPSDRECGKRTWPVVLGVKNAVRVALALAIAAYAAWLLVWWDLRPRVALLAMALAIGAHLVGHCVYAVMRWHKLVREMSTQLFVASALAYVVWFAIPPLVVLLGR